MNWLDEIWYSGYCNETVKFASTTDHATGGEQRVEWLREHSTDCQDCRNAIFFKDMEGKIAKELGVHDEFVKGGDVTKHPQFQTAFGKHMGMAMFTGKLSDGLLGWMENIPKRREQGPWPGHSK